MFMSLQTLFAEHLIIFLGALITSNLIYTSLEMGGMRSKMSYS